MMKTRLTLLAVMLMWAVLGGCETKYVTPPNKPKDPEPEYEVPEGQDKLSFRLMSFNIRESTAEVAGNSISISRRSSVLSTHSLLMLRMESLQAEEWQTLRMTHRLQMADSVRPI